MCRTTNAIFNKITQIGQCLAKPYGVNRLKGLYFRRIENVDGSSPEFARF
jgi:hypothetical protein